MKNDEVDLLHVLFPHVRAEVLLILFRRADREYYVRQIARTSTLSLGTVQQELAKLTEAGLIVDRKHHFYRFYSANRHHKLFHILHDLVIRGSGKRAFVSRRKRPHQRWRERRPRPESKIRNRYIRRPFG